MVPAWVAIAISGLAVAVSVFGVLYTQSRTGRRDVEQWRRGELWKLTASFLALSTERQSELMDYTESFMMGYRGPDRPVRASEKLWQMELLVQQFRLLDGGVAEKAEAIYVAHRDADARAAYADPREGPITEAEERLVPNLDDLHRDLVQRFRTVFLRRRLRRWRR
ncbi:hypothetical protein EV580_0103 [Mycobacterium sp. BK086]|uniref:hypothetical protein n=1 Tax=Mycobacterium sp. BK086 TaxID=2512165 RepID=UPI001060A890|nr:hypothetical protein [Mycobacterium sp. BK086]TDO16939.1 hypothetical protein EV580_0103 [Mycobacterium sp. BK086]